MDKLKQQIPNFLTLTRLVLAFVYPLVAPSFRIPLIVLSLLTEFFDGYLARLWNVKSKFGAFMDPVADKCFLFSVIFIIFLETDLSWWLLILIGFRDLVVFFVASFLIFEYNLKPFFNVHPRMLGKLATTSQFCLALSVLYFDEFIPLITYSTVGISILAGIDYLYLLKVKKFYRET